MIFEKVLPVNPFHVIEQAKTLTAAHNLCWKRVYVDTYRSPVWMFAFESFAPLARRAALRIIFQFDVGIWVECRTSCLAGNADKKILPIQSEQWKLMEPEEVFVFFSSSISLSLVFCCVLFTDHSSFVQWCNLFCCGSKRVVFISCYLVSILYAYSHTHTQNAHILRNMSMWNLDMDLFDRLDAKTNNAREAAGFCSIHLALHTDQIAVVAWENGSK